MGKFVVSTRTNGDIQFNLLADNDQVILTSQGYSSRANCDQGIESVRKNSGDAARFESETASNGKFFFNLKATNGQVIGTSQMYASMADRDQGIASVMNNAPGASVEEA